MIVGRQILVEAVIHCGIVFYLKSVGVGNKDRVAFRTEEYITDDGQDGDHEQGLHQQNISIQARMIRMI